MSNFMENENTNMINEVEYGSKDWESFVQGKLIGFMQANGIETINVDTKKGQKAKIRRTKDGVWKVETIFQETL